MPEMSSKAGQHTEVLHAQLLSKAVLRPEETELYELSQLAGITLDPEVFKILLDMLKLNIPPMAIVQTLRSMCSPHRHDNSFMLSRGEPHPGASSSSSSLQQHLKDLSLTSNSSRSTSGDRHGRHTSGQQRRTANVSSSNTHDASGLTGGSTRSSSGDRPDSVEPRPREKLGHSSSSRAESFVTTRPRSSATDYSYRDTEKQSKKRSSYR